MNRITHSDFFKTRQKDFLNSLLWGTVTAWIIKDTLTPLIFDGRSFDGRGIFFQGILLAIILFLCLAIFFGIFWLVDALIYRFVRGAQRFVRAKYAPSCDAPVRRVGHSVIVCLPKSFVSVLLASFYSLAFILSPYWQIPKQPMFEAGMLLGILIFGAVWSFLASGNLKIQFRLKELIALLVLLIGILVLNYNSLISVIPWRGDEGYHLVKTLSFASLINFKWLFSLALIFTALVVLAWHRPGRAIAFGITQFSLLQWLQPLPRIDAYGILRYPFVNYWFSAIAPKIAMFFGGAYHEALYRVVPFIAAVGLAWYFQRDLSDEPSPLNLLWAFSAALVPIVYFYSAMLYLEMPAVFLMVVVSLNIKTLVQGDLETIRDTPAWYALILIGFIKETVLPFLLIFIAVRILARWIHFLTQKDIKPKNLFWKSLADETKVVFITLFPILFYLFCRKVFTDTRDYSFNFSQLMDISLYRMMGQSLIDQFGIYLLLFIVGLALLIRRKEYWTAGFTLLVLIFVSVFFMLDQEKYIGYSRFNLFLLPPIFVGVGYFIKSVKRWRYRVRFALAAGVLMLCFFQSAVYWEDGNPYFGRSDYFNYSGQHYPYDDALSWLKENHAHERLYFTGMFRDYYFDFYFNQLDWTPDYKMVVLKYDTPDEAKELARALTDAQKENFDIVVYHVVGDQVPHPIDASHFQQVKIFKRFGHLLVIFARANGV